MYKVIMDGQILYHPEHPSATLTEPVLELEPGYAGTFSAVIPYDNPMYGMVHSRQSMVSVYRDNTEIFYGEVRKIPQVDRYRNKEIYCTGALSFLADSIQPAAEYHDISPMALLQAMLDIHNGQVEERKRIQLGYVAITDPNDSLYRYTNYETTLDAIRDKLVGRLGGCLRLRHEGGVLTLDWVPIDQYGDYSTQPIEFGLNLLDYSETTSAEDVVTALIPRGAVIEEESEEMSTSPLEQRVDITSVNDGVNYVYIPAAVERFGWVWAENSWDDVTVPANLKSKAEAWLSSTQYESMELKLSAADLSELGEDYDAFAEGDRIRCKAAPYGMDIVLPIMKLTIPLQNPAGRTLELSNHRLETYTSSQSAAIKHAEEYHVEETAAVNRNIQIGINNLTAMVTGARGGYKLSEYDEDGRWIRDLYMDTPDKDTAQRILQINKDGIAGSTTGYAGPYTVGITIDGQIQGSWIAAGSIETNHLGVGVNTIIQGLEDGIETKVGKGEIISSINQSSESVTIEASRINLNGAVTANNNFRIYTDGSMEATAGWIGGFRIYDDYLAFGDYIDEYDWPLECTPRGEGGNVYIGQGGISADSYCASTSDYAHIVKISEGMISFSKFQNRNYLCGSIGVDQTRYIQMVIKDCNDDPILNINENWAEFDGQVAMHQYMHALDDVDVDGNFHVSGTKSRAAKTKDYGERLFYAYETPSPMFGDTGEGKIAEDGLCYVVLDPIFSQCVQTGSYQVFLQKYGEGDLFVADRNPSRFIVSGTPGLSFGWELKAKQTDYSQLRLERYMRKKRKEKKQIDYGKEGAKHIAEVEKERLGK